MDILKTGRFHRIVIVGKAKAGKTTLTNELKKMPQLEGFAFYHTDDYGDEYGHVPGLYCLIDELMELEQDWIVEGVMGVRLLRKIEQLSTAIARLRPDLIIMVKTKRHSLERHAFLNRGIAKIWREYLAIRSVEVPVLEVWT